MADSGPRLRVARPATPRSAATSTSAGSAEPLPVPEPTYAAAGPRKSKSLCAAYLCWIIGGFWGLHHFYLERDQQAWLWFSSFGGLGVGWLLDLCLMRRYVDDCNETPEVIDSYRIALKYRARPAGSIVRWLADIFVSNWFGFMMTGIYDKDLTPAWAQALLYAVGAAVGVWLVNSAGSDRSASLYQTVRHSLVGFGLGWFTTQYCGQFSISPSVGAVCGALHGVNRDLRFRVPVQCIPVWPEDRLAAPTAQPPPEHGGDGSGVVPARGSSSAAAPAVRAIKPASRPTQRITARRARSTCLRAVWFGMWITLCLSVLGLHLYYNLTLSVEGGEQLKLKEHLHNVAKSPVWQQLPQAIRQLYDHARAYGFANTWKDFVKALDMDGEQHAYSVLGLTPDATDTDIKQAFRRLALQYHPDKQPAELRETAEQEFVKITQAHDTLMKINEKKRRRRQRMNPDH